MEINEHRGCIALELRTVNLTDGCGETDVAFQTYLRRENRNFAPVSTKNPPLSLEEQLRRHGGRRGSIEVSNRLREFFGIVSSVEETNRAAFSSKGPGF